VSRYHAILASVARPVRRERVKELSLSRQRESNRIPSFDEVLAVLKDSDGWRSELESRTDHKPGEDERIEAEKAAAESGAARPPEGVWSSEWEDAVEAELARAPEAAMEAEQRDQYDFTVANVEGFDGQDCWREITLRKGVDPRALRSVGQFWSVSKEHAEAHWGRFKPGMRKVLLRAKIDLGNVDLAGTVHARMDMTTGEDELEVRVLRHAPVWVYDATLAEGLARPSGRRSWPDDMGTFVKINGWRRA
jgi:hypothetical protein